MKNKNTFEDNFDACMSMLEEIELKLKQKVQEKEENKSPVQRKKNSHIHIMINTEEKQKLMDKAKLEGIDFSEWCRRKLREGNQLDRIENKIDIIIKSKYTE